MDVQAGLIFTLMSKAKCHQFQHGKTHEFLFQFWDSEV
jgi:hypothetical protein